MSTHPNDPNRLYNDQEQLECDDCGTPGTEERLLACLVPGPSGPWYRCEQCFDAHQKECKACQEGYEPTSAPPPAGVTNSHAAKLANGCLIVASMDDTRHCYVKVLSADGEELGCWTISDQLEDPARTVSNIIERCRVSS